MLKFWAVALERAPRLKVWCSAMPPIDPILQPFTLQLKAGPVVTLPDSFQVWKAKLLEVVLLLPPRAYKSSSTMRALEGTSVGKVESANRSTLVMPVLELKEAESSGNGGTSLTSCQLRGKGVVPPRVQL